MGVNPHAIREPETLVERIAFALAAHDITGGEGYLSDDELEGAEIIWRKCQALCPNLHHLSSAARFFGIPEATYQRYIYKFIWLLKHERGRRDNNGKATMQADLLQAFWPDYLPAAKAAYSVILEDPKVLKALKTKKGIKDAETPA